MKKRVLSIFLCLCLMAGLMAVMPSGLAQEIADCRVRDSIRISGRLQSRIYTKVTEDGPIQRTAYEISALTGEALQEQAEDYT